ncbi:MAG: hypothetical protein ACTSYX_11925 [Candidatus Thorarchaeota archaeon]
MVTVGDIDWKRFLEGLRLGLVSDLVQQNSVDGDDCIRGYYDGETLVASMLVCGSNAHAIGHECERVFQVTQEIKDACAHLVILTDEQQEEWADAGGEAQWALDRGVIL